MGGGEREGWGPGIPVPQLDFGNFDDQSTSSLCKINSCGFLHFQVCYTQLIGVFTISMLCMVVFCLLLLNIQKYDFQILPSSIMSWPDQSTDDQSLSCINIPEVRLQFLIRPEFSAWSSLSVV